MEFTEEFIETNGLSEEQVKAVNGFVQSEIVPNIKKEYDGKANENAERIIDGAIKSTQEAFGIDIPRNQGEKQADYLKRVLPSVFKNKEDEIARKQKEIDDKLANFKGGEEYKAQLDKLNQEKDALLRQVAELEPLKGYDEKYKEASEKLTSMQKPVEKKEEKVEQNTEPQKKAEKPEETTKEDLVEEYTKLYGKKPFHGWDEKKLSEMIEAKK